MDNFKNVFYSATVKLTVGFLTSIMILAIGFSILIYNTTSSEFDARFETFKSRLIITGALPEDFDFSSVREQQSKDVHQTVTIILVYANLTIMLIGGLASYWMARKILQPIEDIHESQARFTSDASHELRTPLTVMKSEMEVILRDKKASVKDYREVIASSLEEVDRLSRLSTTLLKIARLDDVSITKSRIDLVKTVRYTLRALSLPKGRYEFTHPSKTMNVLANRESITDLLFILVENAQKYSPEDSVIRVNIAKRGTRAEITVSNEGNGISASDLRKIFQRFYRVDASRKSTTVSGHGLGLNLAKRIVELHNGELLATSAPNEITTFTVRLPLKR